MRSLLILALLTTGAVPTLAGTVPYDFTLKPAQSGLNAGVGVSFHTAGTLIGNYHATDNPTGTRTKPGLFGSFGSTENLPVEITTFDVGINGNPNSQTGGAFSLAIDADLGVVNLSNLALNFLQSGPAVLNATVSIETESFRTRNPTSTYPGGIPITLPIGQLTLTSLTAMQVGGAVPGVITPIGPGTYQIVMAPLVEIAGEVDVLGTPMMLPPTIAPLPLAGTLVLSGDDALLTALQPIDFAQSLDPNLALPETPLELPTILPPGNVANVLLNLMLESVTATIDGELSLTANGVRVPEPSAAACAALLLLAGALRRGR